MAKTQEMTKFADTVKNSSLLTQEEKKMLLTTETDWADFEQVEKKSKPQSRGQKSRGPCRYKDSCNNRNCWFEHPSGQERTGLQSRGQQDR